MEKKIFIVKYDHKSGDLSAEILNECYHSSATINVLEILIEADNIFDAVAKCKNLINDLYNNLQDIFN